MAEFQRRQCQCASTGNTPVLLPGKSHGRRSLVGCSPWGREESDTTERLHSHFSLSCIREGNSNALQCSWLENPRDGGARWAAVCGVIQSRTRLKRLSSSSSRNGSQPKGLFGFNALRCTLLCMVTILKKSGNCFQQWALNSFHIYSLVWEVSL